MEQSSHNFLNRFVHLILNPMNSMQKALLLALGVFLCSTTFAQDETTSPPATSPQTPPAYKATPAHMWEFGIHGGSAFSLGDVEFVPNWGAGIHVRRAIDYVFSIRGEGLYATLKHDDNDDGTSETTFQSGSLQLLVSLNNLIWNDKPRRKTNVYGLMGAGVNRFEVDVKKAVNPQLKKLDPTVQTHADFGFGIAFRIADRFNLGFETKGQVIFGNDADLLDGIARQDNDVLVYSSARLNFNLGNKEKRAEPLYWVNPLDVIMQDITELKNRPAFDMTDTDGDGVIDLIDTDNSTPPGVAVDTRGKPLDSDADGIPNHQDDEPYVPAAAKIAGQGQGPGQTGQTGPTGQRQGQNQSQRDLPFTTEEDVERIVDERLNEYAEVGSLPGSLAGNGITSWFLPIIHFGIDSHKIRFADYGNLASIAKVMKNNPALRIVVTGFTDKTASDTYNLDLSFKRAKAAIEHLVNVHGIARSRLILNYNGEDAPLVPSAGSSMMNRRVEFRVATGADIDMEQPIPISKKDRKNGY